MVTKARNLAITGLLCAILIVLSQIIIPIGIIPVSLSVMGVFLIGSMLPPKYAFMAAMGYILLGIAGIPVFSGLRGGIAILLGPTGGYLFSYPIMVLVISIGIAKFGKKRRLASIIVSMSIALIVCYTIGTLWLAFVTGISLGKALMTGVVPFIIFDVGKICVAIAANLWYLKRRGYLIG